MPPRRQPHLPDAETDRAALLHLDRQPRLLPVRDVAVLLGVSRQTVYNLVAEGQVTAVHVSRRAMRVVTSSVADFVRRMAEQAAESGG
jgi:excisionase family DNA binding protein